MRRFLASLASVVVRRHDFFEVSPRARLGPSSLFRGARRGCLNSVVELEHGSEHERVFARRALEVDLCFEHLHASRARDSSLEPD